MQRLSYIQAKHFKELAYLQKEKLELYKEFFREIDSDPVYAAQRLDSIYKLSSMQYARCENLRPMFHNDIYSVLLQVGTILLHESDCINNVKNNPPEKIRSERTSLEDIFELQTHLNFNFAVKEESSHDYRERLLSERLRAQQTIVSLE